MSTFRKPIQIVAVDTTVFPDLVSNQITAAATPSIGDLVAYVMNDAGSDEGVRGRFSIPKNFVGTPKLVVKGILDGAVGATDTLGFGVRKRAVANNEAADGSFDAEQTVSATIGATGGSSHSDEDLIELSITLTAGDYAVDDEVFVYVYIDASGTTYAGNFLLLAVEFEYTDV